MSFYSIRYEYADESNSNQSATSRHSSASLAGAAVADPPLFLQEGEADEFLVNHPFLEEQAMHHQQQHEQLQHFGQYQQGNSNSYFWPHQSYSEQQQHFVHHHHFENADMQLAQKRTLFQAEHGVNSSEFSPHQQQLGAHGNFFDEDQNEEELEHQQQENNNPRLTKKFMQLEQKQPGHHPLRAVQNVQAEPKRAQQSLDSRFTLKRELLDDDVEEEDQEQKHPVHLQHQQQHCKRDWSPYMEQQQRHNDGTRLIIVGGGERRRQRPGRVVDEHENDDDDEVKNVNSLDMAEENDGMDETGDYEAMLNLNASNSSAVKGEPQMASNGFTKPAYSYSCLIGLSLKNSPDGELTVSEIYDFLCHHFPYFREAPSGWKNSVRHNLSLNKCFKKIEIVTPGNQGRKSCLWTMNPARRLKMDQELKKWRDRDEARIFAAMQQPADLDALQSGTMGMPPGIRPRRFHVPPPVKQERRATAHRARNAAGGHGFSSSLPASMPAPSFGQQEQHYSGQRATAHAQFAHEQFSLSVRPRQPSNCLPPMPHPAQSQQVQSHGTNATATAQSVHAQAARKLESLLKRRKSSTSPTAGTMGDGQLVVPGEFQDGIGKWEAGGGGGRRRRSAESASGSSGHCSRRQSQQRRTSDENAAAIATNLDSLDTSPAIIYAPKSAADHSKRLARTPHGIGTLSQTERHRQAAAASYLYQQLSKTAAQLAGDGGAEDQENLLPAGQQQRRRQRHGPLEQSVSHRPLHAPQFPLDQPLELAPLGSPTQLLTAASACPPMPSPFTSTCGGGILGLESCENALLHNQLLDSALQQQSSCSQSPK